MMTIARLGWRIALGIALLAAPTLAQAHSSRHGPFGTAHHGHPINAWKGSHRMHLR